MNFQISSEKIGNPLLVDLLRKVCRCFGEIEQDFFVIGATARDILIRQLVGISSGRKTRDLDVAIAIPHWDAFEGIKQQLLASGFQKMSKCTNASTMEPMRWISFLMER